MKQFKITVFFILTILLFTASYRAPSYIAGAVNVMCAQTGVVLYESNQHQRHYPASIVKVMTALMVLENVTDLNEILTISERAATLPWYAASMSLRTGDQMTVWDALHGIMLPSANEVANALAEHVSGTIEDFVLLMNRRAYELGAINTRFVNACGLPGERQHITAYDMSLIMREAVTHPAFISVIGTEFYTFPPSQVHPDGRTMRNTNRLIRDEDSLYSQFVVGGKTGWITAARNTLSTYSIKDDRGLIVTVLYTDGAAATFADTIALLSHGFALLAEVPLPPAPPREIVIETPAYVPSPAIIIPPTVENTPAHEQVIIPTYPHSNEQPPPPWEAVATLARTLATILAGIFIVILILISFIYWRNRHGHDVYEYHRGDIKR